MPRVADAARCRVWRVQDTVESGPANAQRQRRESLARIAYSQRRTWAVGRSGVLSDVVCRFNQTRSAPTNTLDKLLDPRPE
jgi:hypothetical protein